MVRLPHTPLLLCEIVCGNLNNRQNILKYLENLAKLKNATNKEVNYLIEEQQLIEKGIGYIDTHLLASCLISQPATLWSQDSRLHKIAEGLAIKL